MRVKTIMESVNNMLCELNDRNEECKSRLQNNCRKTTEIWPIAKLSYIVVLLGKLLTGSTQGRQRTMVTGERCRKIDFICRINCKVEEGGSLNLLFVHV